MTSLQRFVFWNPTILVLCEGHLGGSFHKGTVMRREFLREGTVMLFKAFPCNYAIVKSVSMPWRHCEKRFHAMTSNDNSGINMCDFILHIQFDAIFVAFSHNIFSCAPMPIETPSWQQNDEYLISLFRRKMCMWFTQSLYGHISLRPSDAYKRQ